MLDRAGVSAVTVSAPFGRDSFESVASSVLLLVAVSRGDAISHRLGIVPPLGRKLDAGGTLERQHPTDQGTVITNLEVPDLASVG